MDQTKHDLTAHTRADVMAILNARLADSIDRMHHEVTSIKRKVGREMEAYAKTTDRSVTVMQRVAICFTGGVLGALAVVLFSQVLFGSGISGALGVKGPISLKSPDIYRPLFWGGLWGIPFGLCIKTAWERLYLFGLLYFLAPVLALFLLFLPMSGAGYFGLRQGGPMFTAYLLLVNVPFGIITAVAARAIIGKQPWALRTGEQPRWRVSRLQTIRSQHPSTS